MLISVGERISCSLCAMAIHDLGHEAISLTGSQAGIVTDTAHGKAKIVDIRARRIHEALDAERIVLVAGFQGVSTDFDITTLGRGGSDTTAVAIAAALGAEACEIYTDVDGVHHRRSARGPKRAEAARGQLRGDARDGRVRREGAPATLGRVCAQSRCQAARAVELFGSPRHLDSRGGREDAREGAHLRGDPHGGRERLPDRGGLPLRNSSERSPRPESTSTRWPRRARRSSSRHPSAARPTRFSTVSAFAGRSGRISAR